jgi:hypothetical protein
MVIFIKKFDLIKKQTYKKSKNIFRNREYIKNLQVFLNFEA